MRSSKSAKTFDICLAEMLRRVGRTMDPEFFKKDQWYYESSWTQGEEDDFKEWMKKVLKSRHRWRKVLIEKEIAMFLLSYSWRYVPEGCMKVEGTNGTKVK